MKRFFRPLSAILVVLPFVLSSCGDDDPIPTIDFTYEANGHEVTFTANASDADTYAWDFGDGETSTEKNPVHAYLAAGDYDVTCAVSGPGGDNVVTKTVAVPVTDIDNLAGTWKLNEKEPATAYTINYSDTIVLQPGTFEYYGMADIFNDEFTFNLDGSFTIDNKNGMSFASIINAAVILGAYSEDAIFDEIKAGNMTLPYDKVNEDYVDSLGVCTFKYAVPTDATFEISEEDFVVSGPQGIGDVTFSGKHLVFSDGAYLGFFNNVTEAFIQELTKDKLVVRVFLNGELSVAGINTVTHVIEFTLVRP